MAPYIRRRPLGQRIMDFLSFDAFMWLSEEIETRDWDTTEVGTRVGLALNLIFLIVCANSGRDTCPDDDLFSDIECRSWLGYLASVVTYLLTGAAIFNALYTFTRCRSYRLFEIGIEKPLLTPSARRVRVKSTPNNGSPFRALANVLTAEEADTRAHPDQTRDVWELSVWDPRPMCLRILCLFSPGHLMVYYMFLPLDPMANRPSVIVAKCLFVQVLLSVQLWFLQKQYTQQIKDNTIVQREVMHEYDTKFVHPRLQRPVRDVGTQFSNTKDGRCIEYVTVGAPVTQISRRFETHPNPNYRKLYDPDGQGSRAVSTGSGPSTGMLANSRTNNMSYPRRSYSQLDYDDSPSNARTISRRSTGVVASNVKRPRTSQTFPSRRETIQMKVEQQQQRDENEEEYDESDDDVNDARAEQPKVNPFATRSKIRQSPVGKRDTIISAFSSSLSGGASQLNGGIVPTASTVATSTEISTDDPSGPILTTEPTTSTYGGSLGVYQHVNSPLRKSASLYDVNGRGAPRSPRNSREMAALEQRQSVDRFRERERERSRLFGGVGNNHTSPSRHDTSLARPSGGRPSATDGVERYPSRR